MCVKLACVNARYICIRPVWVCVDTIFYLVDSVGLLLCRKSEYLLSTTILCVYLFCGFMCGYVLIPGE